MEREKQEISNGVNEKIEKPDNEKERWFKEAALLRERLHRILYREGITIQEKIAISEKMGHFKNDLLKKYGMEGVRECVLYHALAGSDGYEDIVKFLDFPDFDYSVEKFIEKLEEEQGGEKEEKDKK
ncbi:MAG: hypothetical protein PHZ04_01055 [Patescibacteria group bacterium]|nr:hypothetical protein [Patescibacteria group bacterium]MDD5295025.1 hypothetical protein [Patescibacteria group bacterium]MDD5554430.1 hypothetical protein [Patescibacteria group bacterium]